MIPRDGKEGAGRREAHGETTFWGPPVGAPHLVRGEQKAVPRSRVLLQLQALYGLQGLEVVPGSVGITLGSPGVPGERRCISEDSKTPGEMNFGGVGQEALFFESSSGSTCRAWSCRANSVTACLAATHHRSSGWGDSGPSVALSSNALSYS